VQPDFAVFFKEVHSPSFAFLRRRFPRLLRGRHCRLLCSCLALQPSFQRVKERFSGIPFSGINPFGIAVSVDEHILFKRHSFLSCKHNNGAAPLLDRHYPASSLLRATPTSSSADLSGYGFPEVLVHNQPPILYRGKELPDILTVLSTRALSNHPDRLDMCIRLLLPHR
jgi:hypothetical protein